MSYNLANRLFLTVLVGGLAILATSCQKSEQRSSDSSISSSGGEVSTPVLPQPSTSDAIPTQPSTSDAIPISGVTLRGEDITNIEFAEGRKSVSQQGVVTNQVFGADQVAEETLKPKFQNTTLEFRPDGTALMNLIDTNGPNVDPLTYPWSGTWSSVDGHIDFSVGWSGINDSGAEVSHRVQGRIVEVSNGSYVIKMNYQRSHVFAVSRPLPYSHSYYTNATFTQNWN